MEPQVSQPLEASVLHQDKTQNEGRQGADCPSPDEAILERTLEHSQVCLPQPDMDLMRLTLHSAMSSFLLDRFIFELLCKMVKVSWTLPLLALTVLAHAVCDHVNVLLGQILYCSTSLMRLPGSLWQDTRVKSKSLKLSVAKLQIWIVLTSLQEGREKQPPSGANIT